MTIREVISSDIPRLAKLAQTTYRETFGHTMTAGEMEHALASRSEEYFRSVLGKDTILIAVEDDTILGFIQFGEVSYDTVQAATDDIELKKIFVAGSSQGKGIGKQLMDAMLAHDRLTDTRTVYLDVYKENRKAVSLYETYGFRTVGTVPYKADGNIIGEDLLMKLEIEK